MMVGKREGIMLTSSTADPASPMSNSYPLGIPPGRGEQ